jgi:predicted ATPase
MERHQISVGERGMPSGFIIVEDFGPPVALALQDHERQGDFVRRFILTGAPGSGKTSVLRALRVLGYAVVPEAATDVIAAEQAKSHAEPWRDLLFTERIVAKQRARQLRPPAPGTQVQVYDRSPVCTLALARYLGHPVPSALSDEVARIQCEGVYQRRVFLIRPIGFCEPTAARRISYPDSLEFERVHEDTYSGLGFELLHIPAGAIGERAALIDACITSRAGAARNAG